ncbi:MAG: undecaprenyl diphosphate synthase family protein [Desulfurococcales archaeon]|nr:undecaprenyl diphosphate synthase family protein [Desulfurococcales archaeon]MCE4629062.1 undecaprenyl diphosphate synthase family protein [Desulfurococcales archaeon]
MQLPMHVGLIPDGNRRWAKQKGISLYQAYLRGLDVLMEIIDYLSDKGVKYITVFAMSLDNCKKRSKLEIEVLKKITDVAFERVKNHVKVRNGEARILVMGETCIVGEEVTRKANEVMELSRWGSPITVTILYCYSNASEMERINKGFMPSSTIFLPNLDLVIRTGGYPRLSGFLPLRADYAELYATKTLWPDLTIEEVEKALSWYSSLPKNYGR